MKLFAFHASSSHFDNSDPTSICKVQSQKVTAFGTTK